MKETIESFGKSERVDVRIMEYFLSDDEKVAYIPQIDLGTSTEIMETTWKYVVYALIHWFPTDEVLLAAYEEVSRAIKRDYEV